MSASVPERDHDYAELGETLLSRVRRPEFGYGLRLRSRIHICDDGILLVRIEVVRLVHDPVNVRDAVGGLGLERLWELVSRFGEGAEVGLFEIENLLACRAVKGRRRCRVHP